MKSAVTLSIAANEKLAERRRMKITQDVSRLSRWMAADLYLREIDALRFELSVGTCNKELEILANEILSRQQMEHAR